MSKKDYFVIEDENATSKSIDGDEASVSEGVAEEIEETADADAGTGDGDDADNSAGNDTVDEDEGDDVAADADADADVDATADVDAEEDADATADADADAGADDADDEERDVPGVGDGDENVDEDAEDDSKAHVDDDANDASNEDSEAVADDMSQAPEQDPVADAPEEQGTPSETPDEEEPAEQPIEDDKPSIADDTGAEAPAVTAADEPAHDDRFKIPEFVKFPIAVGIAAACAIGGFVIGHISGNPTAGVPASVKTELTNEELGTVVGRVSFDGQTVDVTAKDALMLNDTLNGDSHNYPTADMVVATARSLIMQKDAEKRGIQVTDENLKEFAKGMLGSDDYETIAKEYQIDTESLQALVKSSYISQEVRKQVVGDSEPELAAPPTAPEEGESDKATAEYYTYIIDAAGDEWDAEKQAWADEDGEFATVLKSSKTFDPKEKKATYDDALGAYQVLGSRYSAEASTYDTLWNDYTKELFSKANVTIYSLMS